MERSRQERLHISVGAVCNNNCVFCMEEDRETRSINNAAMTPPRVRWILESNRGAQEVCFTSGEPTTRSELPEFVRWARELGYPRISLMTNGRRIAYLPYAAALAVAGVNRFYISLHGHTSKVHESLTRTPGSFDQTVAGLRAVARVRQRRAPGIDLHTSTVVTKHNLPFLLDIYSFLRASGVDQVVFNVMQASGGADTHFEQLFPRYREIADRFRAFLDSVSEARPQAFLVDIPLCATEGIPDFNRGYVERYRHFEPEEHVLLPVGLSERRGAGQGQGLVLVTRSDLDDEARSKREACGTCRYDRHCEGVWKNYLSRYGWDELIPVKPEAPQ